MSKIPVQKGPIMANFPKTSKMMTQRERLDERANEMRMMKSAQTCEIKVPKK